LEVGVLITEHSNEIVPVLNVVDEQSVVLAQRNVLGIVVSEGWEFAILDIKIAVTTGLVHNHQQVVVGSGAVDEILPLALRHRVAKRNILRELTNLILALVSVPASIAGAVASTVAGTVTAAIASSVARVDSEGVVTGLEAIDTGVPESRARVLDRESHFVGESVVSVVELGLGRVAAGSKIEIAITVGGLVGLHRNGAEAGRNIDMVVLPLLTAQMAIVDSSKVGGTVGNRTIITGITGKAITYVLAAALSVSAAVIRAGGPLAKRM